MKDSKKEKERKKLGKKHKGKKKGNISYIKAALYKL